MSGHSKWSTIKHKKAKEDAVRGKIFTKLIREITVAARTGGSGDPNANPRLRSAILTAKAVNMPKANIENAIKKGTGELQGISYEETTYEGYGPSGIAVFVEALTDNKNRTVPEIRNCFTKHGGNLGEAGCVSWMFHRKGFFTFEKGKIDENLLMEVSLEAGADDVVDDEKDDLIEVYTDPLKFSDVKERFDAKGLQYTVAEISRIPENTVPISGIEAKRLLALIQALEDMDDVQKVYANFDISNEEMERLSA
jgi:YebC/PmpR family DNA-binding regulatory protein